MSSGTNESTSGVRRERNLMASNTCVQVCVFVCGGCSFSASSMSSGTNGSTSGVRGTRNFKFVYLYVVDVLRLPCPLALMEAPQVKFLVPLTPEVLPLVPEDMEDAEGGNPPHTNTFFGGLLFVFYLDN